MGKEEENEKREKDEERGDENNQNWEEKGGRGTGD